MSKKNEKRVVYLFGTGATQAEIDLAHDGVGILMSHVRDGILGRISTNPGLRKRYPGLVNELSSPSIDVEHLITLYESSGTTKHAKIARLLKKEFREEIQGQLGKLGGDFSPKLYPALIDMHEVEGLEETITGILTLNYEDLLDRGAQSVENNIDYGIRMNSEHSHLTVKQGLDFPVLKLHGSFNWKNTFPVTLIDDDKIKNAEDVLWIPPGVEKNRLRYPFSLIWGRAIEILDCDILRVVGCSLSRNDWQLVSLLYTTQKLSSSRGYTIELINPRKDCKRITDDYTYLSCRMISDILEVRESIAKSLGVAAKEIKDETIAQYLENKDVFDLWLHSKGEWLQSKSIPIGTSSEIFENYMRES